MTPRPKQIVIDKCAFQRAIDKKLCSFAKDHMLVLPHDLYGEIVTDRKADKREIHLRRFRRAMVSGAYWGFSVRSMVETEGRTSQRFGSLTDLDETRRMRDLLVSGQAFCSDYVDDIATWNLDSAKVVLDNNGMVCQKAAPQILASAEAHRLELEPRVSREERLQFLVERVDASVDVRALAVSAFQRLVRNSSKFCLSRDWLSWQHIRLITVLFLEYSFLKRSRGGDRAQMSAEHDLYDVQYVVLLSRADAIITQDKGVIQLARAAFPEKDVFSSLEEVPDSYRCDWAGS